MLSVGGGVYLHLLLLLSKIYFMCMRVHVYVCPQHTREEHRVTRSNWLALSTMPVLGIELGTALAVHAYLQVEKTPFICTIYP